MSMNNFGLRLGSKGDDVIKWKKYLNLYGAELDETNDVFDMDTEWWTKDLQDANEMDVTGIVDSATWERFAPDMSLLAFDGTPTDTSADTPPTDATSGTLPVFNYTPTDLPTIDTTPFADTKKGQELFGKYTAAKGNLEKYTGYKPKEYTSEWEDEIRALMGQITGREKFSYDVNEDALDQQMTDQVIETGKLARDDTMAKAAAMTGGYGSSYGQSVGQQAFQGELGKLNDAIPELYQMALNRYTAEGQELLNQYGLLMDRDERDYGRHMDFENIRYQLKQDEYERLLNDLGIAGDDYDRAMEMYYADQDRQNAAAWQEYDASEEARKYANSLLQQGYENEMGEWSENNENEWREREWERNENRYQDSRNDGNGENTVQFNADGSVDLSSIPGIKTDDPTWFNEKGQFIKAEFKGSDGGSGDEEKNVYRMNGKNISVPKGVSPYTLSKNPDVNNGVMKNGYQPDNIQKVKLRETKDGDYVNGVWQPVYTLPDGTLWIWNDVTNEYMSYEE